MDGPAQDPRDESIGDLFGRLIEDGRAYARAELDLVRLIVRRRAGRARLGFVAIGAGALLLLSALIALVLGVVAGLATLVGPLAAGLIAAAALGLAGWLALRLGIARLHALGGDAEERAALARGEHAP